MPSGCRVFRLLYEARPRADAGALVEEPFAMLSVAVPAEDAQRAQATAFQVLAFCGWDPAGPPLRTSDLTTLLESGHVSSEDSAYGHTAERWLRGVHEEALQDGASLHVLTDNYGFLEQPRRLPLPPGLHCGLRT